MSIAGLSSVILIISIIAVLVLAGVIVIIVLAVTSKNKKKQPAPVSPTPPSAPVPACPQPDPVIAAGIARNALRFMGLYEGIYTNVTNPSAADPGAYREWHIRMQNLHEDAEFCNAFIRHFPQSSATPAQLEYLLACIFASGIRRGTERTHIANSATKDAYVYLGSGSICPGASYTVVKPSWTLNGLTVEQGILA